MKVVNIEILCESKKSELQKYEEALEVYNSLTPKEKKFVCPNGAYVNSNKIVKRFLEYEMSQPIGFLDLYDFDNNKSLFLVFAVKNNFRHMGVGRRLFARAIEFVKRTSNYNTIIYEANKKNSVSIKFAEKNNLILFDEDNENYKFKLNVY